MYVSAGIRVLPEEPFFSWSCEPYLQFRLPLCNSLRLFCQRDTHKGCTTGTVVRKSFRNLLLFAATHHTRLGTCPPPLRRLTITGAHAHGYSALLLLLFDLRTVATVV